MSYILQEIAQEIGSPNRDVNGFFQDLIQLFYSEAHLTILFNKIYDNKMDTQILSTATQLLKNIYMIFSVVPKSGEQEDDYISPPGVGENEEPAPKKLTQENMNPNFPFPFLSKHIEHLVTLLVTDLQYEKEHVHLSQTKATYSPFGFGKMQVLELITEIIRCQNPLIMNALLQSNAFKTIFSLFETFEWNSILHAHIYRVVITVLSQDSQEMTFHMLHECNIIKFIIDNHNLKAKPGKYQVAIARGYNGYLVKIARYLWEKSATQPALKKQLQEFEGWDDFAESELKPVAEIEKNYEWGKQYNEDYGLPANTQNQDNDSSDS